jgi:drug/metabolite transporter (DMT)-like permease
MSQASAAAPSPVAAAAQERLLIGLALVSLYFIWGSTYLGIHWAVAAGGWASFQLNSTRFIFSGLLLAGILRWRGLPWPTAIQTRNAALIGLFLVIGGNGLTTLALKWGAPSGLSATIIATTSLWAGLWSTLYGKRPHALEWLGMGIGVIGVGVLTLDGNFRSNPAILIQFAAPMLWAFGSILSSKLDMPQGLMASAIEMLAGGLAALPISLALGEHWQMPSANAWWAWLYLVFAGSMIGYNAYIYLLGKVRPAVATSYAYVNPLVALLLGSWLAKEAIDNKTYIALPIILVGVGCIAWSQNQSRQQDNKAALAVAEAAKSR